MVNYIPSARDIAWLDFESQIGSEIKKRRPGLVFSPQSYNIKTNLALFLPITSKIKHYPFEVELNSEQVNGAILCDQIRSLDWKARNAAFLTTISAVKLREVILKFSVLLP